MTVLLQPLFQTVSPLALHVISRCDVLVAEDLVSRTHFPAQDRDVVHRLRGVGSLGGYHRASVHI